MRSLVTAVAMGKIDGELITDLSGIEDKAGEADMPCAMTWFNEEMSLLQFDGKMDLEEFSKCLSFAKDALIKIHELQLETLKRKYIEIQEEHKGGEKE